MRSVRAGIPNRNAVNKTHEYLRNIEGEAFSDADQPVQEKWVFRPRGPNDEQLVQRTYQESAVQWRSNCARALEARSKSDNLIVAVVGYGQVVPQMATKSAGAARVLR